MKAVVFLGNPGLKYRKTRHNIGFMVGDYYIKQKELKWQNATKFGAVIAEYSVDNEKIFLVKPQLFYNRTGESVQKLSSFYKIPTEDILVICDDINLNFGQMRYRKQGSDGGNNGLKSIISSMQSSDFQRIRIGTNNELRNQVGDVDFVLSRFNRAENKELTNVFKQASSKIDEFIG